MISSIDLGVPNVMVILLRAMDRKSARNALRSLRHENRDLFNEACFGSSFHRTINMITIDHSVLRLILLLLHNLVPADSLSKPKSLVYCTILLSNIPRPKKYTILVNHFSSIQNIFSRTCSPSRTTFHITIENSRCNLEEQVQHYVQQKSDALYGWDD